MTLTACPNAQKANVYAVGPMAYMRSAARL